MKKHFMQMQKDLKVKVKDYMFLKYRWQSFYYHLRRVTKKLQSKYPNVFIATFEIVKAKVNRQFSLKYFCSTFEQLWRTRFFNHTPWHVLRELWDINCLCFCFRLMQTDLEFWPQRVQTKTELLFEKIGHNYHCFRAVCVLCLGCREL